MTKMSTTLIDLWLIEEDEDDREDRDGELVEYINQCITLFAPESKVINADD